jgi:hypothetical protein
MVRVSAAGIATATCLANKTNCLIRIAESHQTNYTRDKWPSTVLQSGIPLRIAQYLFPLEVLTFISLSYCWVVA